MPKLQEGLAGDIAQARELLIQKGIGSEVIMLLGENLTDQVPEDREVLEQMAAIGAKVEILSSEVPLTRRDCARVYHLRLIELTS